MRIYQRSQPRIAIARAAARAKPLGAWTLGWGQGRETGRDAPAQGGWMSRGRGRSRGGAARAWNWEAAAPPDSGCGGREDRRELRDRWEPGGKRKASPVLGFWAGKYPCRRFLNGRWMEFGLWTRTMGVNERGGDLS